MKKIKKGTWLQRPNKKIWRYIRRKRLERCKTLGIVDGTNTCILSQGHEGAHVFKWRTYDET